MLNARQAPYYKLRRTLQEIREVNIHISGRLSCYPEYSKYVKNMFTEKEDRREYFYMSHKYL